MGNQKKNKERKWRIGRWKIKRTFYFAENNKEDIEKLLEEINENFGTNLIYGKNVFPFPVKNAINSCFYGFCYKEKSNVSFGKISINKNEVKIKGSIIFYENGSFYYNKKLEGKILERKVYKNESKIDFFLIIRDKNDKEIRKLEKKLYGF